VSREMAYAAIDIWPDEAMEAMHLAALALLEALCGLIASGAAETGVHEYPDPRHALGL
jgi:hypothetical protein